MTAYKALCESAGEADVRVAVRSSATAEDAGETSFAGMHRSFTNILGADAVCEKVVACWVSTFEDRAFTYRAMQQVTTEPAMAVVVHLMVQSTRSGVMFTANPATSDTSHLVIEAAFGQGEVVVSGAVEPDTYIVRRDPLEITDVRVGRKDHEIVRGIDGNDQLVALDAAQGGRRVLDDQELLTIARLGLESRPTMGARKTSSSSSIPLGSRTSCSPGRSRH